MSNVSRHMKNWRGEPDHQYWKLMPQSALSRARYWWGLSAASVAWGLLHWFAPPAPPYTGKWGWFNSLVASNLGWKGFAVLMFGIAAAMLVYGLVEWRASSRKVERRAG